MRLIVFVRATKSKPFLFKPSINQFARIITNEGNGPIARSKSHGDTEVTMSFQAPPYRMPPGRAIVERYDFGVDPDALMGEDLYNEVIGVFTALPSEDAASVLSAVRLIAAAPASIRIELLQDAELAIAKVARRPVARAARAF